MEFILQALTYPQIGKIIYTDANLKTQKAISDVRSMIAQGVDVIVSYPDAGGALLPVYREATKRGIPVNLWSNANIGKPGVDYLNYSGTDICVLGKQFAAVGAGVGGDGMHVALAVQVLRVVKRRDGCHVNARERNRPAGVERFQRGGDHRACGCEDDRCVEVPG